MLKRALIALGLFVVFALVGVYAAGHGWLGADGTAGTPTEVVRPATAHRANATQQGAVARELGVMGPRDAGKQILFGDFHVHTSFSADAFMLGMPLTGGTGSHTVSDACDFARFCSDLDFWSINDHAESSTPRRWRETIEAIGRCDAVGGADGSSDAADLISFVGWEWSHMGTTAENHFGHRNVILRELDAERLPARPIASDSPADYFQLPSPLMMGLLPVIAGDPAYLRYAAYARENDDVERCPDGVPVRELSGDCREYAATPGELFGKLDEWGFDSLVIPHGTTWGMYTPQGSAYEKQLRADFVDPVRQRLVEVYSGHGNTEDYRGWRTIERGPDGERICPPPRDDYLPGCWQAGEIIRARCAAEGNAPEECDARAALTRQRYADAPAGMGHLSVSPTTPDEWQDAGQCRDCFLPAFSYRPQSSVQAMLALSRQPAPGEEPVRFRFGFIGSSDIHSARPGSGYKEIERTKMTDARLARVDLPGPNRTLEPVAHSQVPEPADHRPNEWLERDRVGSFFYTGGLVAVHAAGRSRQAVWDALEARETYATSGPRILIWFDLLNPPGSSTGDPFASAPMGSAVAMTDAPIFRVRAAGSRKQLPGCPDASVEALSAERLERLCSGECFHPSDERRRITRIEVVRIRPQTRSDEDLGALIDDPWLSFACDPDPAGCVVTFSDSDYPSSGRDAVYYARAIEEPSDTINGDTLRCQAGDGTACDRVEPCDPWAPAEEACLAPVEHRAWSSPIFVDRPGPGAGSKRAVSIRRQE